MLKFQSRVLAMPTEDVPLFTPARTPAVRVDIPQISAFRTRRSLWISVLPPVAAAPEVVAEAIEVPVADEPVAGYAGGDIDWRDPKVVLLFCLAGNAKFILTTTAGRNYAVRIKRLSPGTRTKETQYRVELTNSRITLGLLDDFENYRSTAVTVYSQRVSKIFATWWHGLSDHKHMPDFTVRHEGCCGRCSRALTDPLSLAAGIGPECHEMVFGVPRKAGPRVAGAKQAKVVAAHRSASGGLAIQVPSRQQRPLRAPCDIHY
jgi:hypothetical protein